MIKSIDEALKIGPIRRDILKKFQDRLEPLHLPPNPLITLDTWCQLCSGPSNSDGYKLFNASDIRLGYEVNTKAHIVSYLLFVGARGNQQVQHLCGVRYCANHQHLTLGGPRKNGQHASKTKAKTDHLKGSWKLSEPDKIQIKNLHFSHGYPISILMEMFEVSRPTITRIIY